MIKKVGTPIIISNDLLEQANASKDLMGSIVAAAFRRQFEYDTATPERRAEMDREREAELAEERRLEAIRREETVAARVFELYKQLDDDYLGTLRSIAEDEYDRERY